MGQNINKQHEEIWHIARLLYCMHLGDSEGYYDILKIGS